MGFKEDVDTFKTEEQIIGAKRILIELSKESFLNRFVFCVLLLFNKKEIIRRIHNE
jgi:hypothetical protein